MSRLNCTYLPILVGVLLLPLSGCQKDSGNNNGESARTLDERETDSVVDGAVEADPTYHDASGVIVSITPSKAFVVIEHGPIPDFMDAMTMPFAVRDQGLLEGLAPGDSIEFTLTVGDGTYLSRIEKTGSPPSSDGPSAARSPFGSAKDFTLTTLDDKTFRLDDEAGKVLVVNFWATWCAPCREEIPDFVALQERHRDDGLLFVGISVDDAGADAVREFSDEYGINYPVMIDDGEVTNLWGGQYAVPTTFVVGRDGQIRHRAIGAIDRGTLGPIVKDLLAEPRL